MERIRWYLEDYPEGPVDAVTRGIAARAERLMTDLGEQLFRALFGATADTRRLWEMLRPQLSGTRVEVLTSVAGATALPWELLRDPETEQALALRAETLVRAHPQAAQVPRMPASGGDAVRVLLVISRPGAIDVGFRSVARHLVGLQSDATSALHLDVLRPPTFAHLDQALHAAKHAGAPYQVMHFDGHGVWADPGDKQWLRESGLAQAGIVSWDLVSPRRPGAHGYLLFEDPRRSGALQLADGPALGRLLTDTRVSMLFLNACRSAHADPPAGSGPQPSGLHGYVRAYGSLAQEVMDAGVAGVVAMRYNVYVATAARFAADVYTGLLAGQSLGAAVTAGRTRLAARPIGELGARIQDWAVPVVYEAAPLRLMRNAISPGRTTLGSVKAQSALPAPPGLGFIGRDDTLLALDRALSRDPIVLLHGEAGCGKTAAAAEFGRWYQPTGGVPGPVLYTSLSQQPTVAALAEQLAEVFAADLAAQGLDWHTVPEQQRQRLAGQIMRQRALLWIWDDLPPTVETPGHPPGAQSAGRRELLEFLQSARDAKAKILLVSRSDERPWLGDLTARILIPPMIATERTLLARAAASRNGVDLAGMGPSSPAVTAMGGNPRDIIELMGQAFRAGCTNNAEVEAFLAHGGVAVQQGKRDK
jgi:hypothetical protein